MTTQTEMVLKHLKSGRTLTALEALRKYSTLRLAARVAELRGRGFAISTHMVERNGKRVGRYVLCG